MTDYMDNRLSARQMWMVEKHLAQCAECARLTQEITATVQLMQSMERLDTGDAFMAKLHARLDAVEPERARRQSPLTSVRDWLEGAFETLRVRRAPALGLGVGMAALFALFLIPRTPINNPETPSNPPTAIVNTEPLRRNVALSASNPFEDPAAANLQTLASDSPDSDNIQD
jgi:hypothetical protein